MIGIEKKPELWRATPELYIGEKILLQLKGHWWNCFCGWLFAVFYLVAVVWEIWADFDAFTLLTDILMLVVSVAFIGSMLYGRIFVTDRRVICRRLWGEKTFSLPEIILWQAPTQKFMLSDMYSIKLVEDGKSCRLQGLKFTTEDLAFLQQKYPVIISRNWFGITLLSNRR